MTITCFGFDVRGRPGNEVTTLLCKTYIRTLTTIHTYVHVIRMYTFNILLVQTQVDCSPHQTQYKQLQEMEHQDPIVKHGPR